MRFGANINPLSMGVGFFNLNRPKWPDIVVANSGSNNISSLGNVAQ